MIRPIAAALVVISVGATVFGQSQKPPTVPSPQKQSPTAPLVSQKQVDELKSQIAELQNRLHESEAKALELQGRIFSLEIAQSAHKSIILDLTSREYERLDTDNGIFLVSVQDASAYLDGYRVTLNIGNPFYAAYTGFKLTANWNSKYDWNNFTQDSYEKWKKAQKQKEIPFTDTLSPGKWNKIDVLLPSTSGEQLGYFELSMETNEVSLYKDK